MSGAGSEPRIRGESAQDPHPIPPAEGAVTVELGGSRTLVADLVLPDRPKGLVIFAHGSGSGRKSPRNRHVAFLLAKSGWAALLVDLLTPEEAEVDRVTMRGRFDIPRLTSRLVSAVDWAATRTDVRQLPIALFGGSTGGAAALAAAAARPDSVAAVVLRGARSDLAGPSLSRVRAPCLFLVGEEDSDVLEINEASVRELAGRAELVTIPGAGHLFEEPGALDRVARLTVDWLNARFGRPARPVNSA